MRVPGFFAGRSLRRSADNHFAERGRGLAHTANVVIPQRCEKFCHQLGSDLCQDRCTKPDPPGTPGTPSTQVQKVCCVGGAPVLSQKRFLKIED